LAVITAEEASESTYHCGMALSLSECELVNKRLSFMERLKSNESKYDSSLGRMSEISKELAFSYRVYL
jgi:hypothetical protein